MKWRLFGRSGESKRAREQRERLEEQFAADAVTPASEQATRERPQPGAEEPRAPGPPSPPGAPADDDT